MYWLLFNTKKYIVCLRPLDNENICKIKWSDGESCSFTLLLLFNTKKIHCLRPLDNKNICKIKCFDGESCSFYPSNYYYCLIYQKYFFFVHLTVKKISKIKCILFLVLPYYFILPKIFFSISSPLDNKNICKLNVLTVKVAVATLLLVI